MQFWMKSFQKPNLGEDEYETAAIITMTEAEASTLYQILKARGEEVHYIDRNSSVFEKRTYRHDLLSCKRSGIRPGIRCVPGCRKPDVESGKIYLRNKSIT